MSAKKACLEPRRKERQRHRRAATRPPKRPRQPEVIRDFLRNEPRQTHTRRPVLSKVERGRR